MLPMLIVSLIAIFAGLSWYFFKKKEIFWTHHGVYQISHSTFLDNIKVFFSKKTSSDLDEVLYHSLREDQKFCGFVQMQAPFLLVKDLDIVKKLLIKDFNHFDGRKSLGKIRSQPILKKLIGNLRGEEWRGVRASLSPAFSSGKIRRMMEYIDSVSNNWTNQLKNKIKENGGEDVIISVANETTDLSADIIAKSVFGIDAGTIENPTSLFSVMSKRLSKVDLGLILRFMLITNFPTLANFLGIPLFDSEALSFFETIIRKGMQARMEGTIKRNDFLQMVVLARKGHLRTEDIEELSQYEKDARLLTKGSEPEKQSWLDDDDIAMAQMIGFFFAGFTTTSNYLSFIMYCLAVYPHCQRKLRDELNSKLFVDGKSDIDYDLLNKLDYLDMFISEVNRKYPASGRLERKCTKDYVDVENNFSVPKDAFLAIPVQAIHNDRKYYDFPDKFYPEHFSEENKAKRSPYAYLPFGIGPRNCLGMRFVIVEIKAAVAHLVHNFELSPASSTPVPLKTKSVALGVVIPDNLELKLRLASNF